VIATLAFALWPVLAIILYRKLPLGLATIWIILAGQLLLPVGEGIAIKIPMVPQFDKGSVPSICAFIGCLVAARRAPRFFYSIGVTEVLIIAYLGGPIITSELNGDALVFGRTVLPGVGIYDAISAAEGAFISLLPFFLGRQFLRGSTDSLAILRTLVVTGLIYSLPMLFEIRFSPQLHYWLYGSYSSDISQELRDGGFRPVVFMGHGLLAAFYIMTTVVAAAALWRTRVRVFNLPPAIVNLYLGVVLVLDKSFGALVYALALVPMVRFGRPRLQLRIALVLVFIALFYPMMRYLDLVPTKLILDSVSTISADRAASLNTRFEFESALLERASQRFLFGWGRYGRSRLYSAENGGDMTLSDGHWVITLGQFGLFGFIAEFGLLLMGVVRAVAAFRLLESASEKVYLSAVALILAINVLDLLPNSGLIPWTWLLAGALLGRSEAILARKPRLADFAKERSASNRLVTSHPVLKRVL
jgi:hypothetical protein